MSTLAQFGLWQKAQELLKPGSQTGQGGHNPGKAHDETRADTGSNRASQANRPFSSNHTRDAEKYTDTHESNAASHVVDDETRFSRFARFRDEKEPAEQEVAVNRAAAKTEPDPVAPVSWPSLHPGPGSLQARLVAVGATVNTYGKRASVRAPDGIPLELVREVEARGWAIIPGGKPNPEAEHDSWLAGVPIAEFER